VDLRDLDVTGWDCANQFEGLRKVRTRGTQSNEESVAAGDLVCIHSGRHRHGRILKKGCGLRREPSKQAQGELTEHRKANSIDTKTRWCPLTGWLVLEYAGPPETTNCGSPVFHDWHLEILENPSDHAPQVGDPTPIICEITATD